MTKASIYVPAVEAVKAISSGQRVYVHGSASTPHLLLEALSHRASELSDVEIVAISTLGTMPLAKPELSDSFYINSLFVSENIRGAVNSGRGDYIPIFLSEIGRLFRQGILPLDVALIQVSPPDVHGFCSLGVSVDVAKAAVEMAKIVIAQVNPNFPRTHGDGMIHLKQIDYLVEGMQELPVVDYGSKLSENDRKIGDLIASLVEDRSTLQLGIGSIPDAVTKSLTNHKDLGVHTEMFSDGIIDLMECGAVTNKYKKKHKGKTVTSFAIGSKRLYEKVNDNPEFAFLEASYVNDSAVIRQNKKVVAINCAIEIDITGQVCADSIGPKQFSGVGGQMDFIRGASLSEEGKPIIALGSATKSGKSKIVPHLTSGAGVVTTRAHVHYVVTEYGIAYLYGKNLRQRAELLRDIAHPDHRESLDEVIFERFGKKVF